MKSIKIENGLGGFNITFFSWNDNKTINSYFLSTGMKCDKTILKNSHDTFTICFITLEHLYIIHFVKTKRIFYISWEFKGTRGYCGEASVRYIKSLYIFFYIQYEKREEEAKEQKTI